MGKRVHIENQTQRKCGIYYILCELGSTTVDGTNILHWLIYTYIYMFIYMYETVANNGVFTKIPLCTGFFIKRTAMPFVLKTPLVSEASCHRHPNVQGSWMVWDGSGWVFQHILGCPPFQYSPEN